MSKLGEEFDGDFQEYDALNALTVLEQIHKQHHVDLRSFESNEINIRITMLYLDLLGMLSLNQQTVGDLNGSVSVRSSEQWSNTGTSVHVARQPDRNNVNGLSMACVTGDNITTSILRLPPIS